MAEFKSERDLDMTDSHLQAYGPPRVRACIFNYYQPSRNKEMELIHIVGLALEVWVFKIKYFYIQ